MPPFVWSYGWNLDYEIACIGYSWSIVYYYLSTRPMLPTSYSILMSMCMLASHLTLSTIYSNLIAIVMWPISLCFAVYYNTFNIIYYIQITKWLNWWLGFNNNIFIINALHLVVVLISATIPIFSMPINIKFAYLCRNSSIQILFKLIPKILRIVYKTIKNSL